MSDTVRTFFFAFCACSKLGEPIVVTLSVSVILRNLWNPSMDIDKILFLSRRRIVISVHVCEMINLTHFLEAELEFLTIWLMMDRLTKLYMT